VGEYSSWISLVAQFTLVSYLFTVVLALYKGAQGSFGVWAYVALGLTALLVLGTLGVLGYVAHYKISKKMGRRK
jgi:hypothetical protein